MKRLAIFLILAISAMAQDAPKPQEQTATVVIYRAKQFTAKLKSPLVYCDDSPLAYIQNGRYFVVKIPVGDHFFGSEDDGVGVTIHARADGKYFVRIEMALGTWKATQQITEVGQDQAQREMKQTKPLDRDKVVNRKAVLL